MRGKSICLYNIVLQLCEIFLYQMKFIHFGSEHNTEGLKTEFCFVFSASVPLSMAKSTTL